MRKTLLALLFLVTTLGRGRVIVDSDSDAEEAFQIPILPNPADLPNRPDDWVDLSTEEEDVRVSVRRMITAMPTNFLQDITKFKRKFVVSSLFVIFARAVLHDQETPIEELTNATEHVIGAGTTQIYKTFMPAAAALAGVPRGCHACR